MADPVQHIVMKFTLRFAPTQYYCVNCMSFVVSLQNVLQMNYDP